MKKKKIWIGLLGVGMAFAMASCGETNDSPNNANKPTEVVTGDKDEDQKKEGEVTFPENETDQTKLQTAGKTQAQALFDSSGVTGDEKVVLSIALKYVQLKIELTDGTVEEVKTEINRYYKYLYDAVNLVKTNASTVADIKTKIKKEIDLVEQSAESIVPEVNALYIKLFCEGLKSKIESAKTNEEVQAVLKQATETALSYVNQIISEEVENLVKDAKAKIDTLYASIMAKASNNIKPAIDEVYNTALYNISKIHNAEEATDIANIIKSFKESITKIGQDLIEYTLDEYKIMAKEKVEEYLTSLISKLPSTDWNEQINEFKTAEIAKITEITSLEDAKGLAAVIEKDFKDYSTELLGDIVADLKAKAKAVLDEKYADASSKISDADIKAQLTQFYNDAITSLDSIEDFDGVSETINRIKSDFLDNVKTAIANELNKLKNDAIAYVRNVVNDALELISNENIKRDIQAYANTELGKIQAIDSLDSAKTTISEIKTETQTYITNKLQEVLKELKTNAKAKLGAIVEEGLAKLPSATLKQSLNDYYEQQIAIIDAVDKAEDMKDKTTEVIDNTKLYIKELVATTLVEARNTMKSYLEIIYSKFNSTPYDFIPEAMRENFVENKVNPSDIAYDFTNFTNVSSINYGGFGEQWNMVLDNLAKNQRICKVFSKGEVVLNAAVLAANTYLNSKYADSLKYDLEEAGFILSLNYENKVLYYDVEFKTSLTIPLLGEFTPKIHMEYNGDTGVKTFDIKLSDTNELKYEMTEDSYQFAMQIGIPKGNRTSYVSISTADDGTITGNLYEYTSISGKDVIKACADFYITDEYVSVVGNKASGMVAFKGYINELYKPTEGKLLGYEVREELTILGVTGTYNTLWFNLSDISGITNVKVLEKSDANQSDKSTVDVYVNNSANLLSPTYNKKGFVKTSRKYDIELRTRHYYSYDVENDAYIDNEVEIPMMFIQEGENYNTFIADILADNQIVTTITMNNDDYEKILADYDTLIDVFIENKDKITSEYIATYLHGEE